MAGKMKDWQEALVIPIGIVAASVGYELLQQAMSSTATPSHLASSPQGPRARTTDGLLWRAVLPVHPRIAIVELFGPISGGARAGEYVQLLDGLRMDGRVRAVILEIDSPGGSAPASEYLYRAVARLARRKPVIAFIRGMGASGAYLVSCGATRVIALPTAIIGSIGVISISPVIKDLLKRLGVEVTVSKSGPYKDMGAFYREATEEERKKQQELVTEFFDSFVDLVAQSRKMPVETVRKYATGEVFTGKRAKEYGLIDEIGDLDMAVQIASRMGNVPPRIMYARPRRPLVQRLLSRISSSIVEEIEAELEQRIGSLVYYRSSMG